MESVYTLDQFTHARVIIGILTGFSMSRILNGLGRMIQRPARGDGRSLQLAWALFLMLWVTHFWWFEFGVAPGGRWSFGLYLFTIAYVALFYFVCVVLFPDAADEPDGYASYFLAHRGWFFALLALLFVADAGFSTLKGVEHLALLGPAYAVKQGLLIGLAVAAMILPATRLHLGLAVVAIGLQAAWVLRSLGMVV